LTELVDPDAEKIGAAPVEFFRDMLQQDLGPARSASFSTCRVEQRDMIIDITEYHTATGEGILPLDNDILIHVAQLLLLMVVFLRIKLRFSGFIIRSLLTTACLTLCRVGTGTLSGFLYDRLLHEFLCQHTENSLARKPPHEVHYTPGMRCPAHRVISRKHISIALR